MVSAFITATQKEALRTRGYSEEAIHEMAPETAHGILGLRQTDELSVNAYSVGGLDFGRPILFPVPSTREVIEHALTYAGRGWHVFPAPRGEKKSHKSAEHSGGRKWGKTVDPDEIRSDFARWPNANIGVATGRESGIWVCEIDTKKGHDVDGIASLARLEEKHGALPPTLMAESPSGSMHFYFRWPTDGREIRNSTSGIAPGIDVRGEGGMVIAPPSIRADGVYKWVNDLPVADAPAWLVEMAVAAYGGNGKERQPAAELEAEDLELVAAAVAVIPNSDDNTVHGWQYWNNVGMATFAATGGKGFAVFDTWSQKAKRSYDAKDTFERWNSYFKSPPNRIGAGTLFHLANEASPTWSNGYYAKAQAALRAASDPDSASAKRLFAKLGGTVEAEAPQAEQRQARAQPQPQQATQAQTIYVIETFRHGEVRPEPGPQLVRYRLPEVGKGLLSGQWGTFKTFMFLDLACSIMVGGFWTKEPVYRQGGVLLFAPEGAGGIPLRLDAMVRNTLPGVVAGLRGLPKTLTPRSVDPARLPFEWTKTCPPLLGAADPISSMMRIAEQAHERFMREFNLPLVMIGIDTMAAASNATSDDDNAEWARILAMMEMYGQMSGTAVVGVDHYGKSIEAGTRGASAKEANADFVLSTLAERTLAGEVKNTRLALRKLRDGPQGMEFPFAGRQVNMGVDRHDLPVTSRVIDWSVTAQERRQTPAEAALLGALTTAITQHGEMIVVEGREVTAARRDWVRQAFKQAYLGFKPMTSTEAVKKAFQRALVDAEGVATQGEDWVYLEEGPM
jgi:hypothetical protein